MVIFASITNFRLSFFQNLLANVVNINYIYEAIVKAGADGNDTSMYYNAGLIANIALEIPAIETGALDFHHKEAKLLRSERLQILRDDLRYEESDQNDQ